MVNTSQIKEFNSSASLNFFKYIRSTHNIELTERQLLYFDACNENSLVFIRQTQRGEGITTFLACYALHVVMNHLPQVCWMLPNSRLCRHTEKYVTSLSETAYKNKGKIRFFVPTPYTKLELFMGHSRNCLIIENAHDYETDVLYQILYRASLQTAKVILIGERIPGSYFDRMFHAAITLS